MEKDPELKKVISSIIDAGYQIDKKAFEFLEEASRIVDPKTLIQNVLEDADDLLENRLWINRELLEKKVADLRSSQTSLPDSSGVGKTASRPYAKEIDPDLEVLGDPTGKISTTGSLEDYVEYFRDRFTKLRKVMNSRMDVRDARTIGDVLKAPAKSKAKMICLISDKRESRRGIFLQVEDLEASATVFVPSEKPEIFHKAQRLALDQIACVCVVRGRGDLSVAQDIIFPDIPLRKPSKAPIPVYVALLSDLHVGSKMFMKKAFARFTLWLRGELGDSRLREIASHIKYVVIAGDIVDGVGVYPKQMDELEISDIYRQYEAAANMIGDIPDYIEVVVIPGNHDATRRALPQPALPKEYAEPLHEARRIYSLGNPSAISLHGVNVLALHGRSLDDVISTLPKMSFQAPDEAMKFLLQCRHVAPAYGLRTMIAAEKEDHLVIGRVPDVFHAGHVHMMRYSSYRGTLVVNSGAWQRQTEYQREMGHTPNPGIVPIVDLQSLQVLPVSFESSA
ncbi:MAG: DNA-directed DNA polymerase II small subunit [Candidatus Bathyarchaeota archaeon]|nr:DNA-directed DNA polymerase II small subunit [Candidatus Bathyarchaeota archaeon]